MGALIGKIENGFNGLTKTGVVAPTGSTNYFSDPVAAAKEMGIESARTAQPGTSDVQGLIGDPQISPIPMANAGDVIPGPDQVTARFNPPPESAQPQSFRPTFAAAQDHPEEMTTKGKVLSLLLTGAEGAARGAAAAVPTNPHISPGLGPSAMAGFETPFAMKQQSNELTKEQQDLLDRRQESELRQEQINNAPLRLAGTQGKFGTHASRDGLFERSCAKPEGSKGTSSAERSGTRIDRR